MTEVFDSTIHDAARAARIHEEAAELERQQAATKAVAEAHAARREGERRRVEDADVDLLSGLLGGVQTRDQLLDYIRATRNEQPAPAYTPPPMTERMKAELAAEQEAGRAAVAKAEAGLALQRKIAAAALEREREGAGEVPPVGGGNLG